MNMKTRQRVKLVLLVLGLLLINPSLLRAAEMPDLSKNGQSSISVTMLDKNTDKPIPGGEAELIQVASVKVDNGFVFVPVQGFQTEDFTFDLSEKADLSDPALAANINIFVENHAFAITGKKQQIPASGENVGRVTFTGLDLGLYLIRETKAAEGYAKINPFLVTIPQKTESGYVYDVDATPKPGKVSELKKATQACPKIRKKITTESTGTTVPSTDKFYFVMKRLDGAAPAVSNKSGAAAQGGSVESQDSESIVLVLTGQGDLEIGSITFDKEGEYFYQVTEQKGQDSHYTYDDTVYWIKYVVGKNAAEDGLEVKQTEVRKGGPTGTVVSDTAVLPFENKYTPGTSPGPSPSTTPGGGSSSSGGGSSSSRLPQTGQLWWPMWLLAGCGAVLIMAGILISGRTSQKKKNGSSAG